eukprot:SM000039S14543  [mRNA]  locus=s39:838687:844494:+ [translate_table: standard]
MAASSGARPRPRHGPLFLLPTNVRARKYTLVLRPDLESFTFEGSLSVDLDVLEESKELKFHADELEIHKAEVVSEGQTTEIESACITLDKEAATATLQLKDAQLQKGSAVLKLAYSGTLNDNMVGFYRASFVMNGKKQYLATTQFEATEARKALPCWDEPALKAVFDVTLVVPKGLIGLSNMPQIGEEVRDDGSRAVHFADTPVMSSYLLAFVVGDVQKITTSTKEGVEVNVYTTPGRTDEGQFALKVAADILSFFTSYFGIPYPLPKADLIAIPDFAMGAMENWGLVTFRETALLVDEANASAATRQRVAYVVSHELAHQWFGNLVTMQWWNDLWLNEGFATWVGWLGVDSVFPEWDVWTQFVSSDMSRALSTDALLSSHPIEVPITDPKEIQQVFDALSYQKGACVIRQLEAALGHADFKKGLHEYLSAHKYGNTVTNDLWSALAEASGKPVKEMMDSWTAQMGYPLITVTGSPGGPLQLRQSRFLSKGPPSPEEDSQLWWVPVTVVAADSNELPLVVLSEKEGTANSLQVPADGWLKLNQGQTGIYRVNYTPELWHALAGAVQELALPAADRLGISMDAYALAKAGVLPTSQALELTTAYINETDYTVWSQLSADFGELDSLLSAQECHPLLEELGRKLYAGIAKKVGWQADKSESHLVAMLRPLVLSKLGSFQDEATIAECRKQFNELQADLTSVHPDLRQLVMAVSVRNGGRAEYEAAQALFRQAETQDFKIKCLTAMGQTRQEELVKEFLDFGLNEDEVKAQDILYVFASLAGNKYGRDIQWEYVKEHWGVLYERFHSAHGLIQHVACLPFRGFLSEDKADDVAAFYDANPVPGATMEIARTLEAVRSRAAWLRRDLEDIASWLTSHQSKSNI